MTVKALPEVLRDLESAVAWLRSLGVKTGGTRIDRYVKILRDAIANESRSKFDHQSHPPFLNALVETSEIIDIATLKTSDLSSHDTLTKLRTVSKGPEVMTPTGHDSARDHAFEFAVAATLTEADQFGGFSTLGGDVVASPGAWPIECKRISSLSKIEQRLHDARNQLRELVSKGSPPGVIALDMTRPIRISLGTILARSGEELADKAEEHLTAYVMRYIMRREYMEPIECPEVLGLMVRYRAIGVAGDSHNIRRSTVWQACSLHPDTSAENSLFMKVAAPIGAGELTKIDWPHVQAALAAVPRGTDETRQI